MNASAAAVVRSVRGGLGWMDGLLVANEANSARERLMLTWLFEELRGVGYDGGHVRPVRVAR